MELMPRIVAEFSREELLCAYRSFERYLNEHGITGVCDVSLMAMPGLDFVRDDLFGALHFVVFPNGEQTNVDAEFVEQLARLSGILSYYGVGMGENPQGT